MYSIPRPVAQRSASAAQTNVFLWHIRESDFTPRAGHIASLIKIITRAPLRVAKWIMCAISFNYEHARAATRRESARIALLELLCIIFDPARIMFWLRVVIMTGVALGHMCS